MTISPDRLVWRRSHFCGTSACMEIASDSRAVYLRDSKDPRGALLEFDHAVWRTLITEIKAERFPGQWAAA